jgi:hypothetical protein
MKTSMPVQSLFTYARKKAAALGKSINHLFRASARKASDDGRVEQCIAEFERLSGSGHSDGWRFDRDEIHRRR